MLNVDRREIYRYMGCKGKEPEEAVKEVAEEALSLLLPALTLKEYHQSFPLRWDAKKEEEANSFLPGKDVGAKREGILEERTKSPEEEPYPLIEGIPLRSHSLARNLSGCEEVSLLAVTIGAAPDRFIARARAKGRASLALALQAAGAALIENWCDEVQERIREEVAPRGYYLRPRFSPGYGDLPLSYQRDFFQILKVTQHTGITLSESLLMLPTKSVTAFIGFTREISAPCHRLGCESCTKQDCAFKRT